MDEAIAEYARQCFSLRIGTLSAEQLKLDIGSAYPLDDELTAEVRGLDTFRDDIMDALEDFCDDFGIDGIVDEHGNKIV